MNSFPKPKPYHSIPLNEYAKVWEWEVPFPKAIYIFPLYSTELPELENIELSLIAAFISAKRCTTL